MAWIVRLVSIGAGGAEHTTDVVRIARPDTLADLATLGLSVHPGTSDRYSIAYDQTSPELTMIARDRHGSAQVRPPVASA